MPTPASRELTRVAHGERRQHGSVAIGRAIAGLARRQRGIVARWQLLAIGLTDGAIRHLVLTGRLHPLHRGVYAVGHVALTREARALAAALAFGSRTVVSHRTAAELHGLLEPAPGAIHLTTASTGGHRRRGVVVHETKRLVAADTTRVDGIPAASVPRVIVQVAGSCSPTTFTRLFNAADRKRLVDPLAVAGQLRRGRKGSAAVRSRLAVWTGSPPPESVLEALFDALCIDHGLPAPVLQASPFPHRVQRVDFCWPERRVVVEVDGREWHAIQAAWGEDHDRDLSLRLSGWVPRRYTWAQITRAPSRVAADVLDALVSGAGPRAGAF